jgi:prepilin-type processing-associated H-X9-DG protein
LSISGGTVQLADNVTAGTALAASNVVLTSLSITGNGTLDIGNNRIIIEYGSTATDPIASIAAWIRNGFYGLPGPAIMSSDVATDDEASGFSYGIGYADGADGAVAGLPSGEVEIMFTLLGDANLDGTVNSEDFTPFSTNLGQNGGWDKGDFNYDGTINAEDFTPFSTNLNQSAVLAASAGVLQAVRVPEPVGLSLIAGVAPIFLCRRRRRSAFTIVHGLVVVAIVALMVALLVPTIERLREQANLALCKDNLRKIGGALILYAHANGGELPVSATVENPHVELLDCLVAGKFIGDPKIFYCPSERRAGLSFSDQNFRSGIIGYYYYSAFSASADPSLSKFLRGEVSWPRKLNAAMDPKTWVMSDIWVSALPTSHAGYRKGVNYLMLDGSVGFVGESPRQQFH